MVQKGTPRRLDLMRLRLPAQEGRCCYCGCRIYIARDTPRAQSHWLSRVATWDHIVPRCRGGTRSPDNLALTCKMCNSAKGGRSLDDLGFEPSLPFGGSLGACDRRSMNGDPQQGPVIALPEAGPRQAVEYRPSAAAAGTTSTETLRLSSRRRPCRSSAWWPRPGKRCPRTVPPVRSSCNASRGEWQIRHLGGHRNRGRSVAPPDREVAPCGARDRGCRTARDHLGG